MGTIFFLIYVSMNTKYYSYLTPNRIFTRRFQISDTHCHLRRDGNERWYGGASSIVNTGKHVARRRRFLTTRDVLLFFFGFKTWVCVLSVAFRRVAPVLSSTM
jgi:hypothetical protein